MPTPIGAMTRHIGTQPRDEYELDPQKAWRRGQVLDQMLASTRAPRRQFSCRAFFGPPIHA